MTTLQSSLDKSWGQRQQIADPVLKDLVGGQTDRILDPFGFEALVDSRHGEGSIGAEVDAQDLALNSAR